MNEPQRSHQRLTGIVILIAIIVAATAYLFPKWKTGSERVECIENLCEIQRGAIDYVNKNEIYDLRNVSLNDIESAGFIRKGLKCPSGGDYVLRPDLDPTRASVRCTCAKSKGHTIDD